MLNQYDPNKHHRHSIRNPNWDYRSPGYYFVTICTYQRQNLFENQEFHDIAAHALGRVPEQAHARHVKIDEWIVMPNHLHGILIIIRADILTSSETSSQTGLHNAESGSIGAIVGNFKSLMTRRINNLRPTPGGKVWPRGDYDRIIPNEQELNATRQYIQNNPLRWAEDRENLDDLLTKMRCIK